MSYEVYVINNNTIFTDEDKELDQYDKILEW